MDLSTDVVLHSYVRLARNIKDWKYFSRLTGAEVGSLNLQQGEAMDKLDDFTFRALDELSFAKRQLMVEKNIINPESIVSSGKYMATAQGVRPIVIFNEEDHIRIKCFVPGLDIFSAYNSCSDVEKRLRTVFEFQNHPKYGYLTAALDDCGTGLHVYATMFLPGLALDGKLEQFFKTADSSGVQVKGYVDTLDSTPKGCIFLIENQMAAGSSAMDVLIRMNDIYSHIVDMERESRNHIMEVKRLDIEDRVMRSYGVIQYCRKLTIWDALELIADIKLGVCAGILKDMPDDLDSLFIEMQKYHVLADAMTGPFDKDDIDVDILRAAALRKKLGIKEASIG